ncbi:MAG TPA: N(4)-(beta-N-acetylglucosaminyl)-L-asparaginase [Pyrinomonadaceae bacterium]|nr:N(4)-(beta-N-acetylglucosaminyl)-L-asparaginase [Pyrinomonadaceae bacterium]
MDRRKFLQIPVAAVPAFLASRVFGQERSKFPLSSTMRVKGSVVVSTWDSGITANNGAWPVLRKRGNALDAVEAGGRASELEPSCCVGLDAWPDRDGKVTLDACIMNGNGDCGGVSFLERIKHPVSVARAVMEKTPHVLLSGEGAQAFALANGFKLESGELSDDAKKEYREWLKKSEYKPQINVERQMPGMSQFAPYYFENGTPNHDTMGTVALDASGGLAGMVTTSGMAFKMRGRVGDSPIIGAGLFVDNEVGAATSSGVGEEVIRICGTHTVIEQMRFGRTPEQACREAIRRIVKRDPIKAKDFQVGFVALSKTGVIGAYAVQKGFVYTVTNEQFPEGKIFEAKSHF